MTISYGPKLNLLVDGAQGEEHYEPLMKLLRALDALVQCTAVSSSEGTPPGSPADGTVYVLPDTGLTDAWVGHPSEIARWSSKEGMWEFYVPRSGWLAYIEDESLHKKFDSGAWVELVTSGGPPAVVGFDVAQGSCYIDLTDARIVRTEEDTFYTSAIGRAAPKSSGKRYFELQSSDFTSLTQKMIYGISSFFVFDNYNQPAHSTGSYFYDTAVVADDGQFKANGTEIDPALPLTLASPIGFCVDLDNGTVWISQFGSALFGDPVAGTGGANYGASGIDIYPFVTFFEGYKSATIALSDSEFANAPPSGFVAWNS